MSGCGSYLVRTPGGEGGGVVGEGEELWWDSRRARLSVQKNFHSELPCQETRLWTPLNSFLPHQTLYSTTPSQHIKTIPETMAAGSLQELSEQRLEVPLSEKLLKDVRTVLIQISKPGAPDSTNEKYVSETSYKTL